MQRGWNAYCVRPLSGYDAPGHAGYIYTIVHDHRLPHPLEGWSTFHPPLYYLGASVVWRFLEPAGPRAVIAGVRAIGSLAGLAAGLVTFILVRRLGGGAAVAWVAAALVLFVPVTQMAGTMIGNEAFAAGLAALALPSLLALHQDPRNLRAAAITGLLTGLVLATKYTGLFLASGCVVPFFRRDLDRRALGALGVVVITAGLVAGPVYFRNFRLTGSPIPMTRELEPMRTIEAMLVMGPRKVRDYLSIPPAVFLRPSPYHVSGAPGSHGNRNPAMSSVWGLTYASIWYDPFAQRIPIRFYRDGVYTGPLLTLLGVVPTAVMLLGLVAAACRLIRTRGRSPDAPLVVMTLVGLAFFVAFTWRAPSMAAVKGSYLLPLVVPAGVFFAGGAELLGRLCRTSMLVLSMAAVVSAALVFTGGVIYPTEPRPLEIHFWRHVFPSSNIGEVISLLVDGTDEHRPQR